MNRINIKKIEQEIELELISSMKRNLKRHLKEEKKTGFDFPQWQAKTLKEMKRFQRENISIVREKTEGLNNAISKQLQNELKQGSKRELKKYKKVMGSKYAANKSLSHSFFKLNDRKLTNLIDEVQNGTKLGNYGALRMMDDQYRKVIAKAAMFSNYGAVSPKKAIDMATKDFLNAGINCIEYKNGRRVNIADYCDMALRTANTRAQLIGEGQFRQEIGEHLVKPTRHNTSCEKCAKWEGKILIDDVYSGGSKKDGKYPLLSEAMAQGFFHPRCEHSLSTYYKEVEYVEFDEHGATEETAKQYQEDLNYINQNIYRFQRLEVGSCDEENVNEYAIKRKQWEQMKDNLITVKEREQIKNYTGIDAQRINRAIRRGDITEEIQKKINLLDNAISKAPKLKKEMIVYRGTIPQSLEVFNGKAKITDNDMLKLKGTVQRDLAFMSTSSKTPETLGRNVIMTIKLPKNYKGALSIKKYAHKKFKYQEEVLLKRGNKFYINNVIIKDNKYYLDVEMKL